MGRNVVGASAGGSGVWEDRVEQGEDLSFTHGTPLYASHARTALGFQEEWDSPCVHCQWNPHISRESTSATLTFPRAAVLYNSICIPAVDIYCLFEQRLVGIMVEGTMARVKLFRLGAGRVEDGQRPDVT